ncbi:hypothetical protein LguiA_000197 [Lonicera macranthoides]
MLKRCLPLFGDCCTDGESQRKKDHDGTSMSLNLSIQSNDITVRIIHAGGREERYHNAILASHLLQKYPGMCVALPDVFKNAHTSILKAEEWLLPGQKYYMIPCTTAHKLKRKHSEKGKVKQFVEGEEALLDGKIVGDGNRDYSEETVCSADFYLSREKSLKTRGKKYRKGKKAFVAPIQKPRICREIGWEPSLTSVQEISP